MTNAFYNCSSLETVPEIPSGVGTMEKAFRGCTSLTGTIVINAEPSRYDYCFYGVDFVGQNLNLVGSSSKINQLKATATQ